MWQQYHYTDTLISLHELLDPGNRFNIIAVNDTIEVLLKNTNNAKPLPCEQCVYPYIKCIYSESNRKLNKFDI